MPVTSGASTWRPTGGSLGGAPLALALLAIGDTLVAVSRRRRT